MTDLEPTEEDREVARQIEGRPWSMFPAILAAYRVKLQAEAKREIAERAAQEVSDSLKVSGGFWNLPARIRALGESEPEKLPLIEDHAFWKPAIFVDECCVWLEGKLGHYCKQPAAAHRVSK